jgi:acyl-CoA synthetase (NDP forming)
MDKQQRMASIKPFFDPESVAVIGASRTPGKGGYNAIENLQRLGYRGKIYPVNPGAGEVRGLKAYPDIKSIPEAPELAIIVIPPLQVIRTLEDCAAAGVRAVIIETAGFGETSKPGAQLEKQMLQMAKDSGMRIMGPNSVGTINPSARFDTSLGRLDELFLPKGDIREGTVGFIGQTGLFTGVFLPLINDELGISKIACLGNKCDVDESDMLEYYGEDSRTKVIAMYLESIKDGRRFLDLSRGIVKQKPIIVIKSAVTAGGARASASHTGALAGEDSVYEAAFRQAGIIRVRDFEQLWDTARAFVHAPLPLGNRVAIINLAGSGCVTAVDTCTKYGLKIAELSPSTKAKIKPVYPDWWQVNSPVDVWTAIEASGFEAAYITTTRVVLEDDGVDAVIVIMGAIEWLPGKDVPSIFAGIKKDFPGKPVIAITQLGDREVYLKMRRGFQTINIPCYTTDEDAVFALSAMCRYRERFGLKG